MLVAMCEMIFGTLYLTLYWRGHLFSRVQYDNCTIYFSPYALIKDSRYLRAVIFKYYFFVFIEETIIKM